MRKLIVLSFITLDGVMQAPGAPEEDTSSGFPYGGWQAPYQDDVLDKANESQMSQPFNLLLGRRTYDIFAGYWPQHEEGWPGVSAATKYVASHDPSLKLEWSNSVLLTGDIVEAVKKLKTQDGPELQVWGSGNLCQTLFKHDLVDELRLQIFPLTLGTGKRLFAEGTIPAAFKVTSSQIAPNGVIVTNLERAGEVRTGTIGE